MSKKDIVPIELLNDLDDQLIVQTDTVWENMKMTSKKKKTFWKNSMVKAACMLLVIMSVSMIHPGMRAVMANTFSKLGSLLGIRENIAEYTEIINQSQSKNGITVSLEEVVRIDNSMAFLIDMSWDDTVVLSEVLEKPEIYYPRNIKYNGEEIVAESGNYAEGNIETDEKNKARFVNCYNYCDGALPDQIKTIQLEMDVYKTQTLEMNEEPTHFEFKFSVSNSELTQHIKEYTHKKEYNIIGGADASIAEDNTDADKKMPFTWEKVMITPLRSYIAITPNEAMKKELEQHTAEYFMKGTDSKGNSLFFRYNENNTFEAVFEEYLSSLEKFNMPDLESEWLELQLYKAPTEPYRMSKDEKEAFLKRMDRDSEESELDQTEKDAAIEESIEADYSYSYEEGVPVGETFRIYLSDE